MRVYRPGKPWLEDFGNVYLFAKNRHSDAEMINVDTLTLVSSGWAICTAKEAKRTKCCLNVRAGTDEYRKAMAAYAAAKLKSG